MCILSHRTYRAHVRRLLRWSIVWLQIFCVLFWTCTGMANPLNGTVTAGSASISQSGNSLIVNQMTDRAIINWQGFSIHPGELTQFNQPSSSAAILNRVTGGNPSAILGTLQSNGQVFLINPNGIVFGAGATVNVGGVVASTLDIPDAQFMQGGNLQFSGSSPAGVVNYGTIRALEGNIFLIGASVENHGVLQATNGTVGLAAGQSVTLVDSAHPALAVRATSESIGGTGVTNTGLIESLQAELLANGGNVYALAINNEGTIRANGYEERGGRVFLVADGGRIHSSGNLIAKRGADGGDVLLHAGGQPGSEVVVTGTIDVSGQKRGGTIAIKAAHIDLAQGKIYFGGGDVSGNLLLSLGPTTVNGPLEGTATGNFLNFNSPPNQESIPDNGVPPRIIVSTPNGGNVLNGNGVTVQGGTGFDGFTIQSADPNNQFISGITFNLDKSGPSPPSSTPVTFVVKVLGDPVPRSQTLTIAQLNAISPSSRLRFEATGGELIEQITITSTSNVLNQIKQIRDVQVAAGVIIVKKDTVPDSTQAFTFDLTGPNAFTKTFSLVDNGQETTNLLAGTYTLTETAVPGYFTTISITGDTIANSSSSGLVTTVVLDTSESITVKYTNTLGGKIIVQKEVITTTPGDNTALFPFTSNASGLSSFSLASDNGTGSSATSDFLSPGSYSVTEGTVPAGFEFTSISGSPSSGQTANVTLAAGETVTLTFTNTEQGKIVVNKFVDSTTPGDNTALFPFTSNAAGLSSFSLASDNGTGSSATSDFLSPGSYSVTEGTVPAGFEFTSISGSPSSGQTANVTLAAGETVTLTFTNTEQGRIIIKKQTVPSGNQTPFDFEADFVLGPFQLADGQQLTSALLSPGQTFNVRELGLPSGWNTQDIILSGDNGNSWRTLNARSASVVLDPGETVHVIFENTLQPPPSLLFRWDPIYPEGIGSGFGYYVAEERDESEELVGDSSFNLFQPE